MPKINWKTKLDFKSGDEMSKWIDGMEPELNKKTVNAYKIYKILEQVKWGVTTMENAEEKIQNL